MRERLARIFAVVLTTAVVALAAFFASRQNAGRPSVGVAPVVAPPPVVQVPEEVLVRGRVVYDEQGCARCHRFEGQGNPRSPLDGVGGRLTVERIRSFIVADDEVRRTLPASAARVKAGYRSLPSDDLDALVASLAASRAPAPP